MGCNGEERVADFLAGESAAVHAPEEFVFGVDGGGAGVVGTTGGLLVCCGCEEKLVEGFEFPFGFDEMVGEIVEEFGVGWWITHCAEVVGGSDEGVDEVMHPDAVYDDTCSEGVVWAGEPVGESGAAA